jgi:hypothetical protein
MLSRGDDYPVHQTADPVANVATGDRNFYDRYFFNGYARDAEFYFAVALGVYPNRKVMDAAVSVVHRGRQTVLRASRLAPGDRVETSVGPITVQVVEPLRRLRVRVEKNEFGVEMDAEFRARGPAIEEPRFSRRAAQRLTMDYTRLTQHGTWDGKLAVQGHALSLAPQRTWGSRDRSWGVRPVGEPEGGAPLEPPQFFWLWAPLNFPDALTHFDVNEEASGGRWHQMGLVAPADTLDDAGVRRARSVEHRLTLRHGTRHAERAELALALGGQTARIQLTPLYQFYMSGIGYLHPSWGHGTFHGALETTGESFALAEVDEAAPLHLHVQAVCEAKLEGHGGAPQSGIGVLEQLMIGPHEPLGLTGLIDGAI